MKAVLTFFLITTLGITAALAGEREYHRNPDLPETFPFSSAVVVDGVIYLSGEIGVDYKTMTLVEGGVGPETQQIFKNYAATLDQVGASLSDIVKCTVFLDDMSQYAKMNTAYADALPEPKPARSTFGVDGLALGAALEIECLAVKP
ncbi:Rid family hydrolase [Hyphococcus flavus]|uniref:Rid family hydrolase n=1 Tax=Hyphococcus flavus TaxID=1866326 RepID=A0AAE9ZEN0_9PROT|nr:Rid family hydrolase [Hyphococcus flavus]WDI31717.1 Rid family hydrolase [Hyphococcus flavus]